MSATQKFKITKFSIFKVVIFLVGIMLMILWTKHTTKKFDSVWKESNNINPIKCGITGEIDSIRNMGRSIFIKMKTEEKFLIQPWLLYEKVKNYRLSDIFSMINVGDSLIKDSNSNIAYIIKKSNRDTITLKLNDLNYGNLPCTPVLPQ